MHEHKILALVLKDEPDFFEKFKTWKWRETQSQIFCKFLKTINDIFMKKNLKLKEKFF